MRNIDQAFSLICTSPQCTCYPIDKYNCSEKFTQRDLNLLKTTFIRDWVLPPKDLWIYEYWSDSPRRSTLHVQRTERKNQKNSGIYFDCFLQPLKWAGTNMKLISYHRIKLKHFISCKVLSINVFLFIGAASSFEMSTVSRTKAQDVALSNCLLGLKIFFDGP